MALLVRPFQGRSTRQSTDLTLRAKAWPNTRAYEGKQEGPADVGSLRLKRQRLAAMRVIDYKSQTSALVTVTALTSRKRVAALGKWDARAAIYKWVRRAHACGRGRRSRRYCEPPDQRTGLIRLSRESISIGGLDAVGLKEPCDTGGWGGCRQNTRCNDGSPFVALQVVALHFILHTRFRRIQVKRPFSELTCPSLKIRQGTCRPEN